MYHPNRNRESRLPAIFCRERDRGRPSRLTPARCLGPLCSIDSSPVPHDRGPSARAACPHAPAGVLGAAPSPPLLVFWHVPSRARGLQMTIMPHAPSLQAVLFSRRSRRRRSDPPISTAPSAFVD